MRSSPYDGGKMSYIAEKLSPDITCMFMIRDRCHCI